MFGYVVPNKAEMKFREFDVYRAHYCGLCAALRKEGQTCAFSLNYDITFLAMLLNALYEPVCTQKCTRCICHPVKKHKEISDEYSSYAAEMTILLSYYKCLDDFHDDKNVIAFIYSRFLSPKLKRIAKKYPDKIEQVKSSLSEISAAEKEQSLERAANAFGNLLGTIFVPKNDIWRDSLFNMGFYLGKFIYIMDAYDDLEKDIKKRHPNPLIALSQAPEFESECENLLNMMAAESASYFEKLPIIENAEILRNIIYGGIWLRYEEIRTKRANNKQKR